MAKNPAFLTRSGLNPCYAYTNDETDKWWDFDPKNFLVAAASASVTFPKETELSIFLINVCS